MQNIYIDIETIPSQQPGALEAFQKEARENFKAPAGLTKGQAAKDMGKTDAEVKFIGKDDLIAQWEKEMAPKLAESVAEENWRKTALDATQGEVFSIAWAVNDAEIKCVSRDLSHPDSEKGLLVDFFTTLVSELTDKSNTQRRHMWVGQYVAGFDLKFLFQRCVINGIRPLVSLDFNGRHGSEFFDNQIAWAGFKGRASQDSIARALGLPGKPDDIDGSKVWDFIAAGNAERVIEYNKLDVQDVRAIYRRLNFAA